MSLAKQIYIGAGSLLLGKMGGKVFAIIRLVILARLLTREDMGIITLLMMTVALLEMLSQLGADKLLVQAKDGDDAAFQGCVHVARLVRGLVNALVLFAIAGPMARWLGAPEAYSSFAWLAAVPLMRGVVHTDTIRSQRSMRFGPQVKVEVASGAVAAVAAVPLALWLGDFRAGLGCIMIKAAVFAFATHLVATRRYTLAWDRAIVGRLLQFGWPMLVSSALMYAMTHGDKLIVGRFYTKEQLGVYGMAIGLAMTARMTFVSALNSLFLPVLSRSQDNYTQFMRRFGVLSTVLVVIGVGLAVPLVLAGGELMAVIYGPEYAEAGTYIGLLGVLQALQLVRSAPSIAAQAHANSRAMMYANAVRAVALIPMAVAASQQAPLVVLARWACVGEAGAILLMMGYLRRRYDIPMRTLGNGIVVGGLAVLAVSTAGTPLRGLSSDLLTILTAGTVTALTVAATVWALPAAREVMRRGWSDGRAIVRRRALSADAAGESAA